ncbi:MAG: hypothetical protein NXI25_26070 [bacterium]|nr:hypothetical protein [bacterium]
MPFSLFDLTIFISLAQGLVFGGMLMSAPQFKGTDSRYLAFPSIPATSIWAWG